MPQPLTTSSPRVYADPAGTIETDDTCPSHGPCTSVQYPDPIYPGKFMRPMRRCEKCREERAAEESARKARDEQRERDATINRLYGRACIPARFKDRTLDNYRAEGVGQRRALNVARKFVEGWAEQSARGTSLIFTGGPGTGKTHLACGIANAIIEQHQASALFLGALEALRSIKATYNRDSEISEQDAIDNLISPRLLILDEIGVQLGTEHEKMLLFDVLNGRYQECRPTILLSNLSGDDLEQYLGQRVMDRYRECGAVLAFDWESYRGRQ
jgi:DNA replication protein DnaC